MNFLLLLVFLVGFLLEVRNSAKAKFSVANTGIDGYVIVNDRKVTIYLNFTSVDQYLLPGNVSCLASGLHFHVHQTWTYPNFTDHIGATACGSTYTSGHYDPYLACGPKTASTHCKTHTSTECVNSSSAYDHKNKYECNTTTYAQNPYACEVADWSGKYGTLEVVNNITSLSASSFWEVDSKDVRGRSIVFHCANNDARAFCAGFDNESDSSINVLDQPSTTADESYLASIFYHDSNPTGYLAFWKNGNYSGGFNFKNFDTTCTSYIYRIYDSWTSSSSSLIGDSSCSAAVGSVYDPTVSCLYGSDSPFCNYTNYYLCDDTTYSYSCTSSSRYSCSPSDLSGKYGAITTSKDIYTFSGSDALLPPFNLIEGKSIVLECSDYSAKVACAKISNYTYSLIDITSSGSFYNLNLLLTFGTIGLIWFILM